MFSSGSNPAIDPPILRKSISYCERQVCDLLADWVCSSDPAKGIIAREYLPRENQPVFSPEPLNPALPPVEVQGLHFEDPEKDTEKLAERARLVQQARMVTYFGTDKELAQLDR